MVATLVILGASALSLFVIEIMYVEVGRQDLTPFWAAVPTAFSALFIFITSVFGLLNGHDRASWFERTAVMSLILPLAAVLSQPLWAKCGGDTFGMFHFMFVQPLSVFIALVAVAGLIARLHRRRNVDSSQTPSS